MADVAELAGLLWLAITLVHSDGAPSGVEKGWRLRPKARLLPGPGRIGALAVAGTSLVASGVAARMIGDEVVPAALSALSLAAVLVVLIPGGEQRWVLPLAMGALAVRMGLAFALHLYGSSLNVRALVLDDESAYDYGARALLELATNPDIRLTDWSYSWTYLQGHYLSLVVAIYAALEPHPLLPRLANAALGAGGVAVAACIAGQTFGKRAGMAVGLVLAVLPTLVLWSGMLLREALIMVLVAGAFWVALRWRAAPSLGLAILALGILHVLVVLREYVGFALGLLIAAWVLVLVARPLASPARALRRRAVAASVLMAAGASAVVLWLAISSYVDPTQLLYRQMVMRFTPPPIPDASTGAMLPPEREWQPPHPLIVRMEDRAAFSPGRIVSLRLGTGPQEEPGAIVGYQHLSDLQINQHGEPERTASGYFAVLRTGRLVQVGPRDVSPIAAMDPHLAIRYVILGALDGLQEALFAPFSTGIENLAYVLLAADAVVWLCLLALALVGLARHREPYLLIPLGFTALVLAVLAVVPGFPGNLMRHRAVLTYPALVIAAAPELTWLFAGLLSLGREWRLDVPRARAVASARGLHNNQAQ
jgi:hypothetical protein